MLELRLVQGSLLKKVMASIKDLVTDANFDCSSTGFSLQAMDTSHVALVSLLLRSEGFEHYRCDRNISMGMNIGNMSKMLMCGGNDDIVSIQADDGGDSITFMFESPTQDKIADFEMKLMDIDSENLGIPETVYEAIVRMPSAEFARVCKDLSTIGDTVMISVTTEGIKFTTKGDIGAANIVYRQNSSVDKPEEATIIEMEQPVSLTFALRYMNSFTKATSLSNQVTLSLSSDQPFVVEYKIAEMGYIRFYLAPKMDEDEEMGTHVEPVETKKAETNSKVETKSKGDSKPDLKIEPAEESKPLDENIPELAESKPLDENIPEVECKPLAENKSLTESIREVERKPLDENKPNIESNPKAETNGELMKLE